MLNPITYFYLSQRLKSSSDKISFTHYRHLFSIKKLSQSVVTNSILSNCQSWAVSISLLLIQLLSISTVLLGL